MSPNWEPTFAAWSKPPSDTEQEKSDNAEGMIRAAILDSKTFTERNLKVFPQGSYRNNTNVRLDSDVDICVLCKDVCFTDFSFANGLTNEQVGLSDTAYTYSQFKDEVGSALVAKFGSSTVSRGYKAFDIHANSYRVDADVVPCFEHRRYSRDSNGKPTYISGTEFRPDNGGRIINWPEQHYQNGVSKNKATSNNFKFVTRIIKRLRNDMVENKIVAANNIASYLIECLVWNVPNEGFMHETFTADVRYVLAHTFNGTMTDERCQEWREVSELKYLFRASQPWTREQAHSFLSAAWAYIGFE